MKRIEREWAIHPEDMTDDDVRKLSTSELKYVCKHNLLRIDYVKNKLNRKKMAEEIINLRPKITDADFANYYERQEFLAIKRNDKEDLISALTKWKKKYMEAINETRE